MKIPTKIEVTKGTNANGEKLRIGDVLKVGEDISEEDARLLLTYGKAKETKKSTKRKSAQDARMERGQKVTPPTRTGGLNTSSAEGLVG